MSFPSATSRDSFARRLAAFALPWLFSTSGHAALLVLMALSMHWTRERLAPGIANGGVEVSIEPIGEDDSAGDAPGGADLADVGLAAADTVEPALLEQPVTKVVPARREEPVAIGEPLASLEPAPPRVRLDGHAPLGGAGIGTGGSGESGRGSGSGPAGGSKGSGRLRGTPTRTAVFGAVGEGRRFVYVFDRSGSMDGHNGAPLSAAKAELIGSLKNLGQTHQFQIIFYNENPRVFDPTGSVIRLVFGTEQNKYLAQKFVGSITADGGTRHEPALELALKMGPDVIFFLTDADEPRMTSDDLARIARINQGTSINAIEFGFGPQNDPDSFLAQLARQNGGNHVYVDVSRLPGARR